MALPYGPTYLSYGNPQKDPILIIKAPKSRGLGLRFEGLRISKVRDVKMSLGGSSG